MSRLPAVRPQQQEGGLAAIIQAASGRIAQACPQHFTPERLVQLASVLVFKTPKLQNCHPESIITAMIQAGSLGLDLNPSMNEAFLIPRGNEAQFQIGYKGIEKLAINTGVIRHVQPREVCLNDTFEIWYEDEKTHIRHGVDYRKPRGPETHYYAVARFADGSPLVEVMTMEELERIRFSSQSPNAGPWRDWPGEMRKKTVVKRLCKRLPRSADPRVAASFEKLQEAISVDDREYQAPALEHHAANNGNDTGHGRTGAYAPPDQVKAYQAWLRDFVADVNDKWATKWQDPNTGEVPPGVKDLLSTYQVSGHLVKWGVAEGLLNAPEDGGRSRQSDPFAAVIWMRNQHQLIEEAEAYGRRKWKEARARVVEAIKAEQPPPAEDVSREEADPEFDEAEVFGGDAGAEG